MSINNMQLATYLSIAVIAISLFFIGTELTGNALVETGLVNVTIETSASIYFETALLNLGNGSVTPGLRATIDSSGTNANWNGTQATGSLVLENNGNSNVSVTLMSNKTAADFLGGDAPTFSLQVTQIAEPGSCNSITNYTTYQPVTVNPTERLACTNLGYDDATDSIEIEAQVTISDSAAGAKTVGVTATATAA